jgi:phage terminase large subunit GpA-like protein
MGEKAPRQWADYPGRHSSRGHVATAGSATLYARLRFEEVGPGYVHFPTGGRFDAEYFRQLTAEEVSTRYREGRPYRVWTLPPGKRNEALDTMVYALAARTALPYRLDAGPKPPPRPDPPKPLPDVGYFEPPSGPPEEPPETPPRSPGSFRQPARRGRTVVRSAYLSGY